MIAAHFYSWLMHIEMFQVFRTVIHTHVCTDIHIHFSGGSDGKESSCNTRDAGLISGSERSSG